jgi:superfamily II DNA or RNA helicase
MGEIIVRERMFVPSHLVDERDVKKRYVHRFYEESACRRCENRSERHNYICNKCEAYKGKSVTVNRKIVDGIEYFGFPLGDRKNIAKAFDLNIKELGVEDLRTRAKRRYPVKMVGFKPYDYQVPAVNSLKTAGYGILKAPPRSGKTPTMLYTGVTQFKYRIAVIADQKEFLQQFLDHVQEFTNLPDLEAKHKKKLFGFGKKPEHFKDFEIIVCTYQTFLSEKGKKLLKLLNKNFGVVFVDEVHSSGALKYSEILNELWARYKFGATGTDDRKDGRFKIVSQVMGEVTALIDRDQLQAQVFVHPIDFVKSKSQYKGRAGFTYCVNFLSKHKKRNDMIVEWVMKDLEKGHNLLIPVYRKEHVWDLVKRINDAAGKRIADGFVGGAANKSDIAKRQMVLEEAKSGKIRVVIGIRSLMQRGLNVPRWSMIYCVMPINNEPNWKQESSRVLTPFEGKRQPGIRLFVDEHIGLSLGCFTGTYKQCLKFKHKPTEVAHERAIKLMDKHNARKGGGYGDNFNEDDGTVVKSVSKGGTGRGRPFGS